MKWLLHGLLFAICLLLSPLAFSQEASSSASSGTDLIDSSMENLQLVEQTLQQYGTLIPSLQKQIKDSQEMLEISQASSAMLQQQIKDSVGDSAKLTRQLQLLQTTSDKLTADLTAQGQLLISYQARVEQLSKRYGKLLTISESLKKSLALTQTVAVITGLVAAVAILAAILEALYLRK
jgi:septal ring factor EnvC (AmiA/AmiB activator)